MLKRVKTRWWVLLLGAVATAGLAVSLAVLAGGEGELIVTPYSDVIRLEAPGVASLRVQIFDLSGNLLWDSGVVSGGVVDWDRTDEYGERLAYGTYLYLVQGWDSTGALKLKKTGKLALLPGDKVQLQQAPERQAPESPAPGLGLGDVPITLQPMAYHYSDLHVSNRVLIKTETPIVNKQLVISGLSLAGRPGFAIEDQGTGDYFQFLLRDTVGNGSGDTEVRFNIRNESRGQWFDFMRAVYPDTERPKLCFPEGNVGIGTISPAGKLDVRNTVNQPALRIAASAGTNLIEAYNTGSGTATGLVFRVERSTGDVHAVGAFYGAGFYSGSADVAEHINVSEPVEPGDVVEIDPEKPGYFRKARSAYSHLVAGVISSDPGVVLGSNSDPVEGEGDPRPVLALAGRVPVKATTENGPIRVGDLLVASSKPGYAMRCSDPASAVGAVIGKALEPLEEGEGIILVQVTLR